MASFHIAGSSLSTQKSAFTVPHKILNQCASDTVELYPLHSPRNEELDLGICMSKKEKKKKEKGNVNILIDTELLKIYILYCTAAQQHIISLIILKFIHYKFRKNIINSR